MNDVELNRILKSAKLPPRAEEYWKEFPGRVTRQLHRPRPAAQQVRQPEAQDDTTMNEKTPSDNVEFENPGVGRLRGVRPADRRANRRGDGAQWSALHQAGRL